ncbi:GNAT family N-acetyltransferase [Variovorax paradoxus]|uniref:GNAT family N-acetyltransferase n=1 Tax=Variovorax paradoxus TaxID=34073 RepID=UPI003D654790
MPSLRCQEFQGRGVGTARWCHVVEAYGWPCVSAPTKVNSTPHAVPFYERVVFTPRGPEQRRMALHSFRCI